MIIFYIKNNPFINLGDGSHIRFVWSCSNNAVKTHNVNIFHKILATGLPVAKYLIKYNNRSEENDEDEKEPINIELTVQKTEPYNNENAIDFKWSDVKE